MNVLIVDASVAAKWFVEEESSEAALSVLNKGNQLHAPDFLWLEMDSIICKWIRRKAISVEEGSEIRETLGQFPIQLHAFTPCLDTAFTIANQTGQSIYDCLYIALAALLKGRMVTADRKLYDALKNSQFKKHISWVEEAI